MVTLILSGTSGSESTSYACLIGQSATLFNILECFSVFIFFMLVLPCLKLNT